MALDDLDRKMVGGNKRVTIPMESRELLSEALDMLKGMCTNINLALRREGLSERQVLMMASAEARAYQDRLQAVCAAHGVRIREGRPSNAERLRDTGLIRRVK
jgi:hypothetical protein